MDFTHVDESDESPAHSSQESDESTFLLSPNNFVTPDNPSLNDLKIPCESCTVNSTSQENISPDNTLDIIKNLKPLVNDCENVSVSCDGSKIPKGFSPYLLAAYCESSFACPDLEAMFFPMTVIGCPYCYVKFRTRVPVESHWGDCDRLLRYVRKKLRLSAPIGPAPGFKTDERDHVLFEICSGRILEVHQRLSLSFTPLLAQALFPSKEKTPAWVRVSTKIEKIQDDVSNVKSKQE